MDSKEVARRIRYHAPTEDQKELFEHIRALYENLANAVIGPLPDCREASEAMTCLEQSQMWTIAAIIRPPATR